MLSDDVLLCQFIQHRPEVVLQAPPGGGVAKLCVDIDCVGAENLGNRVFICGTGMAGIREIPRGSNRRELHDELNNVV